MPTTTATVQPAELMGLIDEGDGLRILDVRTGAEFESAHIPGSYNIPLDTLNHYVSDLAASDHAVVLVCQSGNRAGKACDTLTSAGKDELRVLDGGMGAWETAGGDVVRGRQRWAMDRQVRLVAGSIVVASMAASVVVPKAKWLAGAVGAGLFFSAATDTCAMGTALSKLPYNRADSPDIDGAVAAMKEAA